ncbi:MAG: hypothetical protein AAGK78_11850, partial [Planctomycetota bacterium]
MADDSSDPSSSAASSDSSDAASPEQLVRPDRMAAARSIHRGDEVSNMPSSLRHIDWREVLPFTHLFRGFEIARHPVKLILALVAVLLIYTGGRALDGIWSLLPGDQDALVGEADLFAEQYFAGVAGRFDETVTERRERLDFSLRQKFSALALEKGVDIDTLDTGDLRQAIIEDRDERLGRIDTTYNDQVEAANRLDEDRRDDALVSAEQSRRRSVRAAYLDAAERWQSIEDATGSGLFIEFYNFELKSFDRIVAGVLGLDFGMMLGGLIAMLWVGPLWAFSQHAVYFSLLFAWSLVVLAVFGGAIARIAAVGVARDEPIQFRSALRFATGKFVSFVSAPLMPVIIIAVIGLVIA